MNIMTMTMMMMMMKELQGGGLLITPLVLPESLC
jgi:hypothetical protein